jgi:hypothetical protein
MNEGDDICERVVAAAFGVADATLAEEIGAGTLHAGTVLATLLVFRDSVALMMPELAERFVPTACEKAAQLKAEHPTSNTQHPTSNE